VEEYLHHVGFTCDLVMGYRENFEKGEAHFACAEKTFQISRSHMTFVGDSLQDGKRAKEARVPFIAKTGTFERKEFQTRFPGVPVISTLSELTTIF